MRAGAARRGRRFVALAAGLTFAASLIFAGPASAIAARRASDTPQSSQKSPAGKSGSSSKKKKKARARREPIQKAPTTDRIEEIQTALAREGYYHGDPSKKWDSNTQEAMRRFQEDHGMTGTGKLDATTLQKLGLGSDIAGVSAPRQVQHPAGTPAPAPPPAPSTSSANSPDPGGN